MERQCPRPQSTQQTPLVPSSGARLSSAMEVPGCTALPPRTRCQYYPRPRCRVLSSVPWGKC